MVARGHHRHQLLAPKTTTVTLLATSYGPWTQGGTDFDRGLQGRRTRRRATWRTTPMPTRASTMMPKWPTKVRYCFVGVLRTPWVMIIVQERTASAN